MSHTPNQLDEDFPGMAERMHALKTSNNRFARLIEEYNELNREIHRVETLFRPDLADLVRLPHEVRPRGQNRDEIVRRRRRLIVVE